MNQTRKHAFSFFSLFVCLLFLGGTSGQAQKTNINRDWMFIHGNPEIAPTALRYDDSAWEHVGLPHSFSIPYFRAKDFYVGYGWYRKTINIPAGWNGKQVYLDFDGVFQEADIYVNGRPAGTHQGGYIGFTLPITSYLKSGENQLAIQVNNLWNARLAPRAGEHVFAGGIYRDVYLRVENPVHVAWNGTCVTTPTVSAREATVQIRTEIANTTTKPTTFQLVQTIRKVGKEKVTSFSETVTVAPNATLAVTQQSGKIASPKLWSPEHPNLYTVETEIIQKGKVQDTYSTPFGFRWFTWTADKGFFLNGEHYYLQGVNVHQDHAGWGDAVTQAGIYRDVKLMKDAGFNMIRGSHYPHHPYFAQVCDELGMLFMSENNVWGIGGHKEDGYWDSSVYPPANEDQPEYEQMAVHSLTEMIRINRNHPSILAWSMCNEPFFTYPALLDKVKALLTKLVDISHQLDSSRIAVIGGAQRGEIDVLGDAAGYNGDGATLYRNPGFPNLVCEYGSCVSDRPGDYDPCWGHVTNGEEPAWRAGHAIWCGFDHGSIAGDMGKMGIVDFFRLPKRGWYWYRNHHLGIAPPAWPVEGTPARLLLTADKTVLNGTDGTDDALLLITVADKVGTPLNNSPVVHLTIESGPGEFPTGRSITFIPTTADDIRIQDGQAGIEFRSYEGGVTRIRATSAGLEDAVINIVTKGMPLYEEGITLLARNRTYNPDSVFRATAQELVNVSQKRPTLASSVAIGSNASAANDASIETSWLPAASDTQPSWQLDMENFYHISKVELSIPIGVSAEFKVELSADDKNWTPVASGVRDKDDKQNVVSISCNPNFKARFLRIVFTKGNCGIQEVEVWGNN